jgi:hypothetical protein
MTVKTKAEARANFEASIAYIPARYEAGVDKADWAGPAKSEQAEKNFADAMSKAIQAKSRQKGVAKVSNEEWKNAAKNKGAPIIGERIRGALDKWEAEWGPMYDQVSAKVGALPPKTGDWRQNINTRLVPTVEAWRKAAGKT